MAERRLLCNPPSYTRHFAFLLWLFCLLLNRSDGLRATEIADSAQPLLPVSASPLTVSLADRDSNTPISVTAGLGQYWKQPDHVIYIFRRHVLIEQGHTQFRADEAIVKLYQDNSSSLSTPINYLSIYLEGNVEIERTGNIVQDQSIAIQLHTTQLDIHTDYLYSQIGNNDPLVLRSEQRLPTPRHKPSLPFDSSRTFRQQNTPFQSAQFSSETVSPVEPTAPATNRRLRVFPRSRVPFSVEVFRKDGSPPEHTVIITRGVNLIIDGIDQLGTVDVETDRMVLWTRALEAPSTQGETTQPGNTPLELYLEGNVIIRQGSGKSQRIIKATKMFYDVDDHRAEIIDGEVKIFDERINGPIRLQAKRFSQLASNRFYALQGWLSSSKMGKPGFRIQASDVYIHGKDEPPNSLTEELFQPNDLSQQSSSNSISHITSVNNFFYLEDLPIFYWPTLSTGLDETQTALQRVRGGQDRIFGTQIYTGWDAFRLFDIENPPETSEWTVNLDYLSKRGPAVGTDFNYEGNAPLLGLSGTYRGFFTGYYLNDGGTDRLSRDRAGLVPETENRGRLLWRHRHELENDLTLLVELALMSDRNFLEQFFENEFDEDKDQESLIYLKQQRENWAWSALVQKRMNPFVTQTNWLPRLDHYLLGQPLMLNSLTWFTHSYGGYGALQPASRPDDPRERTEFVRRPWETDTSAFQVASRHELNYPFQLGPIQLVPYALGELAGWTEDLTGDQSGRAFGTVGMRGSMPFWKTYPYVESHLWNLNGLAHKIIVDWDYSFSESSSAFNNYALFNELDDDSQEHFRRRFTMNTFGGTVPLMFDERYFALRSGIQNSVTSPFTEIADDMHVLRGGIRQRLQTKRGPQNNRRIIDWMTLDVESSWFPEDEKYNFGESFGLIGYDYSWHIGDRTSLLSSGFWDTFEEGANFWSVGAYLNRPPRGNIYLGYDILSGPIENQFLTFSYNYTMSPKWISSFVNQVDLKQNNNVGQSIFLTRIGADFLLSFGFRVDSNKDNVGVSLGIQPRIAPGIQLGKVRGAHIPPSAVAPFE